MEIGKLKLHDQIKTIDQLYFFTSTTRVLWPLVRFPLRWPISTPSLSRTFFPVREIFAHCHFVLNFSLSAQKQHILVLRNTPNCSSVHSGMTGISLAELALHNRCGLESENMQQKPYFCLSKWSPILDCKNGSKPHFFTPLILGDK